MAEDILQGCICTICSQQCEENEAALPSICRNCATSHLLHTLQWARLAALHPVGQPPPSPDSLVLRQWPAGQLLSASSLATHCAANSAAAIPSPSNTTFPAEQEVVWESGLGSGASSNDDSDWEGGGGPVGTVRRRRGPGHGRAISRLKPRRVVRPLTSCPGLLRSHADRPPPPPLPLPVLHSAGVQPAGGNAGEHSTPPSGAPTVHQDVRAAAAAAADGCDTHLSSVVNGETVGGPDGAPTEGGGGAGGPQPLALKTVMDDGLRPEPDRTGDGLEDVSADEGVEEDRTSPVCPPERDSSPRGDHTPSADASAAGDGGGGLYAASLDDVSDEETPADNGIDHEDAGAPAESRQCAPGTGEDGDSETAGAEEAGISAEAESEQEATDTTEQLSPVATTEPGEEGFKSVSLEADESSDVVPVSPDDAAATASMETISDAKEDGLDDGTDVEDEPCEADPLQDKPVESRSETQECISSQEHDESDADSCRTLPIRQADPTDSVTSSEIEAAGLDVVPTGSGADKSESRKASGGEAREDTSPSDRPTGGSEDEPEADTGSPRRADSADDCKLSETGGRVAVDPLASPVYSPVESPTSIHSLDSPSPDRQPAAASGETPSGGHCALGVADASDVSSDEELVCGEGGRPATSSAAEPDQQAAGTWQLLPVESISSPESFGPDQEEPEAPESVTPVPEAEPEASPAETTGPPAAVAAAAVSEEVAAQPAPAPLLCLGTEQISDNEEDGFDDGMEEGEIPSERPPTPPPPPPSQPPVVPPPPLPEPDLQRPLDGGDMYTDTDIPDGDFEEGEIPSEAPLEYTEPPESAEEPPPAEVTSPPPPAVAQVPLSPPEEPPPDGDYEEGEIVEERPASADQPAEDGTESPPPSTAAAPRPASGGEEPAGDLSREEASPVMRPGLPAGGLQPINIDDDDAPDVDEEVRDFVVSEKTITALDRDEGDDVGWKKFSRSARERNYRDGKPSDRVAARSKEVGEQRQESRRSPVGDRRGKKRDIQRYDVRKVITERKMRAQENQDRGGGQTRRSRSSSSSGGSRSPRRLGQRWRRSRSPSRSRSPARRHREHRRRSRERRSPPRRDRSRHSVSRHSPSHLPHSRHSHSRHSLSRSPLHKRTLSPAKKAKDKSRERKRKHSPSPAPVTKKLKKRKEKLKKKDDKKKKKKRPKSPISKAVIADGDNLVVSVNFSSKEHRDRLGTKSRVVRHEEREPSLEFSPVRERPARARELPTPAKDKRPVVRGRDRDLPRRDRDRDRDDRAKPSRDVRPERELSLDRQRRDARKENKDPKQSTRTERKKDGADRRSPSPRPPRGNKRARSVTPPREHRTQSPRTRALSPRPAPRGRAQSPRSPRSKVQGSRDRVASPRARTPSPRSRALSPRPRALSPRNRAASPRARSRSRSSNRPRKYARRSRSGSRSSSWSRSSASSDSSSPRRRRSGSASRRRPRRSPALIELDVIEVSPRRDEPIVITDSEAEAEPVARPAQARSAAAATRPSPAVPAEQPASAPRSAARSPRGPKTPPEPAAVEPSVRFSLSSKLAAVRMINNPLREEEDEAESSPSAAAATTTAAAAAAAAPAAAATAQPATAAPRGPSTPPEPSPSDASEAKFGDQYDPFEPTHSPSGTPDSPPSPDGMASPELVSSPAPEPPPPAAAEPPPPPLPPLPAEQRDRPTEKPPEPRHPAEAEKRPTSHAPPAAPPVAGGLFAGLSPPAAVSLLSSVLNSVLPDTSRPPPSLPAVTTATAPAATAQAPAAAAAAPPPAQNGQRGSADVIDMEVSPFSPDSPNSPDSREGDDLFLPPRPTRAQPSAGSAGRGRRMDPKERFEALFGGVHSRSKATPSKAPPGKSVPGKLAGKQRIPARGGRPGRRTGGKGGAAQMAAAAADADDAFRVVDDVPNSAVEMQVKEKRPVRKAETESPTPDHGTKFLKKLNRQERVIEEVKLVLKPFYHKRTITKEQYKETLRKSVPKICHSKSGEINPKKIHSLIINYVKKCKYTNKKNHITVPNPSTSTPVKGKV